MFVPSLKPSPSIPGSRSLHYINLSSSHGRGCIGLAEGLGEQVQQSGFPGELCGTSGQPGQIGACIAETPRHQLQPTFDVFSRNLREGSEEFHRQVLSREICQLS